MVRRHWPKKKSNQSPMRRCHISSHLLHWIHFLRKCGPLQSHLPVVVVADSRKGRKWIALPCALFANIPRIAYSSDMTEPWTQILCGDALKQLKILPAESVNCCVTSPPYWQLRDYGVDGQIGLESSPEKYVKKLVAVFQEVKRVLRNDGTLWLNLGDSYAGSGKATGRTGEHESWHVRQPTPNSPILRPKNLVGIPWRVAFALQRDGWNLRADIIWHKPSCLPESIKDRPSRCHEYIFLLTKSRTYYYDIDATREPYKEVSFQRLRYSRKPFVTKTPGNYSRPSRQFGIACHPLGRNRRTVWTVAVSRSRGNHHATFPEKLIEPCILAGSPIGGTVLDPFVGSGTVLVVAKRLQRNGIGIDLNSEFAKISSERIREFDS